MLNSTITTNAELCVGCNKCISKCPVGANDSTYEGNDNKIVINQDRCIQCGECIRVCDHNARDFVDDTQHFFYDLEAGENITIIAAPAVRHNFSDYKRMFGFLKNQGVRFFYDVSFGADITTWAYLKAIEEQRLNSIISQPCPVVVAYIQRYKPELIPYLAPVQSPAMCTAIYLRKYKNSNHKIAFISPCIGKSMEFNDENTYGTISYNVTYQKLKEHFSKNSINLNNYPQKDFDDTPCGMGLAFSRPGGLRENVEFYTGGKVWIKQLEGMEKISAYFAEYEQRVKSGKPVAALVDVLNCENGCNFGTGTQNKKQIDDVDSLTNQLKEQVVNTSPNPMDNPLFHYFEETMQWTDFERVYADHTHYVKVPSFTVEEYEHVWQILGKDTPEKRKINCHACGYGSCEKFVTAVLSGHNHKRNCINFARTKLKHSLTEFNELFDSLNDRMNTVQKSLNNFKDSSLDLEDISKLTGLIAINARIESVHAGKQGAAFAVVAGEMKNLADQSQAVIKTTIENEDTIQNEIKELEASLHGMRTEMNDMMN